MHNCYHACMGQMTIRASDELIERVRRAAEYAGESINEYVTETLAARTDPESAGTKIERIRERLSRAGLLERSGPSHAERPDPDKLARARAAAGQGTPLSDLVSEERR